MTFLFKVSKFNEVNFKYQIVGHLSHLGSACKSLMKLHITLLLKGCRNVVEIDETLWVFIVEALFLWQLKGTTKAQSKKKLGTFF